MVSLEQDFAPLPSLGEGRVVPPRNHRKSQPRRVVLREPPAHQLPFAWTSLRFCLNLKLSFCSYLLLLGILHTPGVQGSPRRVDKGWCRLRSPDGTCGSEISAGSWQALLPLARGTLRGAGACSVTRSLCCASKSREEFIQPLRPSPRSVCVRLW